VLINNNSTILATITSAIQARKDILNNFLVTSSGFNYVNCWPCGSINAWSD